VSWSETFAAMTVTVHCSLDAKFVVGSSVNVVPSPEAVAAWTPLVAQLIEYHGSVTVTGSLKVIETFASRATFVAPARGEVADTEGAGSPTMQALSAAQPRPSTVSVA